jgi:hypothetical protein
MIKTKNQNSTKKYCRREYKKRNKSKQEIK